MRVAGRFAAVAAVVVAVLLLVPGSRLGARATEQQAGGTPGQAGQGGQAPSPQVPSFRSGTTLVEVDVIVRGKTGRFVADLRQEEFQVFEDGVLQRVDQCYLVSDSSMDPESPWIADPPLPPSVTERLVAPAPEKRVFVFVFDQLHLPFGNGRRAREAALRFMEKQFRPGDIGGVVVGRAMANRRLTSDRSELTAAVRAVPPSHEAENLSNEYFREWPRFRDPYELYSVAERDVAVTDIVVDRALAESAAGQQEVGRRAEDPGALVGAAELREATYQRVAAKAQRGVDEFRRATLDTLNILKILNTGLAKMEGRKTIVVLSDGFVIEQNTAPLRELEGLAARSNVRIYAIDTRGLVNDAVDGDLMSKVRPETAGAALSPDIAFDGLAELSAATGGFAVDRSNDLDAAIARIDRDTSSYYVLGYRPTNAKQDGSFRKIEVRVTRPDSRVRARRGYVASRF